MSFFVPLTSSRVLKKTMNLDQNVNNIDRETCPLISIIDDSTFMYINICLIAYSPHDN